MAKIMANINDFQRNVKKAQALAKTAIPDEIETDITANTSKFQRGLMRAKAMAQRFRRHEVEIDADTSKFRRAMLTMQRGWAQTQKAQNNFDNTMQSMAQSIRSFGTVFSNQIKGTLIASFQGLIPIIAGLVPAIMAVGNALKVVTGGALGLAGAIAIAAGGFVGFGAMAISAVKMLSDGTLQATKETRNYQSALQGVKDTWSSIIKENQAGIFTTMANGLNAIKVAMKGLTPFLSGVTDGMSKASAKMLDWAKNSNVANNFFKAMGTTGVSIFNDLLNAGGRFGDGLINVFTQLMPLFKWSSQWLERMGTSFSKWANSVKGQNAIKDFMEYTKENLPLIGKIFGNTFAGINNLMKAFGSNSTNIFEALAQMTQKFRDWSETVGKSEGFKKFVDYVQQNGPKIMDLIGNITMLLVNFGTAMAPIASKILDVVNALVSFTSNLFATHPGVAKLVGIMTILGGILLAVIPTIAQMAIFIKDLLIPFISWASKAGLVGKIMSGLGSVLKFVLKPINLLRAGLAALGPVGWIVIGVITALVGAITYLWKTNEDFRNAVTQAWNTIKTTISDAVSGVITWFQQLWSTIQTTLQPIMPLLQQIGAVVSQVLGATFVGAIQLLMLAFNQLWTITQVVWQAVGGIIMVAVQLITGILTAFIQLLTGDFSGAWLTLQTTITNVMNTIYTTIQSIWTTISEFIFNIYNTILGTTISSWSEMWSFISGKLQAIWSSVSSYFNLVLSTIISVMSSVLATINSTWSSIVSVITSHLANAVSAVISGMANMLSNVVNGMVNIVNAAINGMVNFVGSITDGVGRAVSAVRNFIGDFTQAGIDLVMGFINGIREKIGEAVSAAREMASGAIAAVRGALNSHSPSRVLMSIGNDTVNGFVIGIEKLTPKAINASKHLGMAVVDNFNADLVPNVDTSLMRNNVSSAVGNIDGYIDSDVQHSIAENSKPVVNLVVKNEADIELIKSTIEDMSAKEYYS